MALGIQTESGGGADRTPLVKYNAKAGRVYRVDRSQDGQGAWVTDEVEITQGFSFVPDLANIEVGWCLFAAGQAPDMKMVRIGETLPDRPSDKHKQGFRLMVKLGKASGGDVRELAGTAKALIGPIDDLHTKYEAGVKDNPGKLPIVNMTGSNTIVTQTPEGKTSSYAPIFEITKWVDRPAELTAGAAPVEKAAPPAPVAAAGGDASDEEF